MTIQDSLKQYEFEIDEDDPFSARHFVTSFAQNEIEQTTHELAFSRCLPPDIVDMQRLIGEEMDSTYTGGVEVTAESICSKKDLSDTMLAADVAGFTSIHDLATRLGIDNAKQHAINL